MTELTEWGTQPFARLSLGEPNRGPGRVREHDLRVAMAQLGVLNPMDLSVCPAAASYGPDRELANYSDFGPAQTN